MPKIKAETFHTLSKKNSGINDNKENGRIKVFSYSLYGSNGLYWKGMVNVIRAVPKYFSDWQIWIYHDTTVPEHALKKMETINSDSVVVKLINVETDLPVEVHTRWNPMTWRFLVAAHPEVDAYAIRDSDALPTERDARVVNEWLLSNKDFHVIRDHMAHDPSAFAPILGGMWGGLGRAVPNMTQLLQEYYPPRNLSTNSINRAGRSFHRYADDQDFLWTHIMPLAYNNVLQHDSYYCRESHAIAFPLLPSERVPLNFTSTHIDIDNNNNNNNNSSVLSHADIMIALNGQNHSRFAFLGNRFAKTNEIKKSSMLTLKPARERYIQCLQDRQELENALFKQQEDEEERQLVGGGKDGKMPPAEYFARHVDTTFVGERQGKSTEIIAQAMRQKKKNKKQKGK